MRGELGKTLTKIWIIAEQMGVEEKIIIPIFKGIQETHTLKNIDNIKKIGIKTLSIPGIEADDIIGSFAHKVEKSGEQVLIVSHDKDMIQLVTNNINILNISNNEIITPKKIQEKYGIYPQEFIDLLALMGDKSDNIPGVPKIGIKTALFLLQKFSNIQNIYNNLEKVQLLSLRNAKNVSNQLKTYKNIAFLSYKLAQIKLDIPIYIFSIPNA
ncbi:5'-3' exonuclease [Aphis craccivora]|uniref:5'-3' exonuclease n=1 Tax=Aphis craccivora TaxID=307492 RepID=A0A6G0Y4D4_APHCR|nr:5'-3' exonuclease [Aphis craccivora]